MKKFGWILGLVVLIVFVLVFGKTTFLSGLIYNFSNHMLSWFLGITFTISLLIFLSFAMGESEFRGVFFLMASISGILWIIMLIFQTPVTLHQLYLHTSYKDGELVPQNQVRESPYSVALINIRDKNPDPMVFPGDLDYVLGSWISSVEPRGGINPFVKQTDGFFLYDPSAEDMVVKITAKMPFAESGLWFNSSTWFVRGEKYFAEFHEILYVQDPVSKKIFAVISLIKRQGFSRWPYVSNVLVVPTVGEGNVEILSVAEAEADPRLYGLAIRPEWLMSQQVLAYGFRYGVLPAVFNKTGRIDIQKSAVNDENAAPFHLETVAGNMWFTPYSPRRLNTLIGVMMASSHEINAPVIVWSVPDGNGYFGADPLTAKIEGSPSHQGLNWLRNSSNNEGDINCGNISVLEMIPVVRAEANGPHLYFMGYTAMAPKSVEVLFITIVDPKTQIVYQDLYEASDVEAWLRGEFELLPQTMANAQVGTVPEAGGVCTENISEQPTESLVDLIRRLVEELGKRAK